MTLTLTDLFCGAGGSSTGAIQVPGVTIRIASNHWDLAVETHNTNHPGADHLCADLSQVNPRLFPTTDILWASPECTNHSVAKGKRREDSQPDLFGEVLPDAAAERSRATMWDVPRFTEVHRYQAVIVENVVDAWHWEPFQAWLMAMDSLGYDHDVVFLNSMHAQAFGLGAPQSRDRMYVLFWRKGNTRPDFGKVTAPNAVCLECGPVRARQVFKHETRRWGRYRSQYVYRCPNVKCRNAVVEPEYRPAAEIIDWNLLGQRIGDRSRPLADKTMRRIRAGIERYWGPFINDHQYKYRELTLAVPVEGRLHGLVTAYYGNGSTHPTDDPLTTVTATERHGLLMRNNSSPGDGAEMVTPTGEPIRTITTAGHQSLLTAETLTLDIEDVLFRMLEPKEIQGAMDFPDTYCILGNRREQVRQAGNAVTPPAARDLVGIVAESLGVTA